MVSWSEGAGRCEIRAVRVCSERCEILPIHGGRRVYKVLFQGDVRRAQHLQFGGLHQKAAESLSVPDQGDTDRQRYRIHDSTSDEG